jgi:quercetin dioxygenase-like cupin family protein
MHGFVLPLQKNTKEIIFMKSFLKNPRIARILGAVLFGLVASAHAESPAGSPATPSVDPRMHPGEVRVLNLDPKNYKEVVPGKVYMRHWFGTNTSVAMFRVLPGEGEAPRAALHSHGTELGVQMKGNGTMFDEAGRAYPLREGDVMLVRAGIKHTGEFGKSENMILSIVTPARPEYPAEDGVAYFPGSGKPAATQAPSLEGDQGPPVRILFNLNTIADQMDAIIPGQLYFKHWHGVDVSVGAFRMVGNEKGHFPGKMN